MLAIATAPISLSTRQRRNDDFCYSQIFAKRALCEPQILIWKDHGVRCELHAIFALKVLSKFLQWDPYASSMRSTHPEGAWFQYSTRHVPSCGGKNQKYAPILATEAMQRPYIGWNVRLPSTNWSNCDTWSWRASNLKERMRTCIFNNHCNPSSIHLCWIGEGLLRLINSTTWQS